MHVHTLQECLCQNDNGLGLVRRLSPAPAPVAPRVTTGGGFIARRLPTSKPVAVAVPSIYRDRRAMPPVTAESGDYFVQDSGPRLSREQLNVMRDRAAARDSELESRQYSESGDGIASDLENQASDENGIRRAVEDGNAGTGMPVNVLPATDKKSPVPLLALGALLYFIL